MRKTPDHLSETHIVGSRTHQTIVRAEDCHALRLQQIAHVGIADARVPYRMVRTSLKGAYLLACFSGEGRILLDGRWQICRAGMACLAPPHVPHAFHAIPKSRWGFCWVRYHQPRDQKPIITSASPVTARFDARPLRSAISGLYEECDGASDPLAIHHWVELIQTYVMRFAQPWHMDDRLWRLWETVDRQLEAAWSLDRLSEVSHLSAEHLRRLCHQELGRSPMHHVTFLRMRRAAELLEATNSKIENVALSVGYANPFVFSNTFKKWIGWRPSEYRRRGTPTPRTPRAVRLPNKLRA
ncbi:MAG TPA: AraC family transcriptional regulator [Methylomirabilota bacterium]|nr:AraC family transcriptional regulator [Methylomirabilota bacterium]